MNRHLQKFGGRVPGMAAAVAFAVGLVNLASAVTPGIAWRRHLLLQLEPVEAVPVFHTLAVPASIGLMVVAFYLGARRRRAWQIALALMVVLGVIALLKGLDFEEAFLSFAAAGLLWLGRDAFCVRHAPLRRASPVAAALLALAAACGGLVAWLNGGEVFRDELAFVPLLAGAIGVSAIAATTILVFRPLGAPDALPGPAERDAATGLVQAHGRDTLAYFKLRSDAHYHFAGDRRAFLGYRVANGVMLVSGDPVGADSAVPALVEDACEFAEVRGLSFAALGASKELLPVYRSAGLRSLYLGDEAIVDTHEFSLDGRWIRKVRQSVSRLDAAGFTAAIADLEDEALLAELEELSGRWREGAERGFSMAMDSHQGGTVTVARDADGEIRGFIHFVPSYGRRAVSLSSMRRDRETPNGLMEFLVVRSIEALRDRGVREVSLNFAAFARWLERPQGPVERMLGRAVSLANPFFQIESLHRFNAKFGPRWEPRYLVFERRRTLPRVGLAALRIEGQLPKRR